MSHADKSMVLGHPKGSQRVWVECSFDATNDYTDVAESNPDADKDIRGLCPFGGYYMFQESNLSNWVVASSIRLDRILPEEERQAILKEAGYNEELMWRKRTVRPRLKSAITLMLNRFQKEENAQKRLKIQQNLEILAENARKNEALIDAQSEGNEPTYADAFYEQMQKAYQSLDPDAVQVVVNERLAYYKQAAKDPAFREASHRLSPEEVGKNRQEIRNSLLLNPEWLDADEAKAIQKTDGNIAGFTKDGTIYLDPKQMTLETPIHEYVHLWDQVAQKTMPGLFNLSMGVEETDEGVRFLHKIQPGPADRSYGIEVARIAGLPRVVLKRAHEILEKLEQEQRSSGSSPAQFAPSAQVSMFDLSGDAFIEEVASLDPDQLTPRNALDTIYKLVSRARKLRCE